LKPARLRPAAIADRINGARYYRNEAGSAVAERFLTCTRAALMRLEASPAIGSPAHGVSLGIPGLRSWPADGFQVLWFYFERDDYLDIIRLLGERQDIATILAGPHP
jgi:toxin ParE1/3/4